MATRTRPPHLIKVACDDRANGGCARPITEITVSGDGVVMILGALEAQNGDPSGRQTAMVPGMKVRRRRRDSVVGDTTDPADRPPPALRLDLLQARRLAEEASQPFPDGLSFDEGVAAEIEKHQQLLRSWDPAGTTSGDGRRTFACDCHGKRSATVSQARLNAIYQATIAAGRRRITLNDLRRKVG